MAGFRCHCGRRRIGRRGLCARAGAPGRARRRHRAHGGADAQSVRRFPEPGSAGAARSISASTRRRWGPPRITTLRLVAGERAGASRAALCGRRPVAAVPRRSAARRGAGGRRRGDPRGGRERARPPTEQCACASGAKVLTARLRGAGDGQAQPARAGRATHGAMTAYKISLAPSPLRRARWTASCSSSAIAAAISAPAASRTATRRSAGSWMRAPCVTVGPDWTAHLDSHRAPVLRDRRSPVRRALPVGAPRRRLGHPLRLSPPRHDRAQRLSASAISCASFPRSRAMGPRWRCRPALAAAHARLQGVERRARSRRAFLARTRTQLLWAKAVDADLQVGADARLERRARWPRCPRWRASSRASRASRVSRRLPAQRAGYSSSTMK